MVQVIKKFPLRNRNTNLLRYIYDYDTMELLSRYEEITIILCSESTKITKCFIRGKGVGMRHMHEEFCYTTLLFDRI